MTEIMLLVNTRQTHGKQDGKQIGKQSGKHLPCDIFPYI